MRSWSPEGDNKPWEQTGPRAQPSLSLCSCCYSPCKAKIKPFNYWMQTGTGIKMGWDELCLLKD